MKENSYEFELKANKINKFQNFFLLENLKQKLSQTTQIFLIHITESKL